MLHVMHMSLPASAPLLRWQQLMCKPDPASKHCVALCSRSTGLSCTAFHSIKCSLL